MKKIICLITLILLIPSFVLADGVVIPPVDPYVPLDENAQLAAINYQDGLEKMIISVNFDMKNYDEAAWVFPVPAEPNSVVIDIINNFPRFSGEDIISKAKSDVDGIIYATTLTQIYPLFLFFPFRYMTGVSYMAERTATGAVGGTVEGVTVYEHIEKGGISTDIVTSKTAEALYNFLQRKGIQAPIGSLPVFDYYVGKDYTFVVSYITSAEEVVGGSYDYYPYNRQPGIFITFPTDRIYYPLMPTSVYGSKTIPVRLYVIGHVTPDLYPEINSYTRTQYYIQRYGSTYDFETFYGKINANDMKFTKLEINVPSKYFKQDLWIDQVVPPKVEYATGLYYSVSRHPWITGIILILAISSITGAITGLLIFRDYKKYALIGLANVFTIIGLAIAMAFTKTKKLEESLRKEIRKEGLTVVIVDRRKFYFLVLFSILFIITAIIIGYIIKMPLMF
jgi:hypothetical protein